MQLSPETQNQVQHCITRMTIAPLPGNCALASGLAIEAKQLPELVLTSGARPERCLF